MLQYYLVFIVLSYVEQTDKSDIENEANEDITNDTQVESTTIPQTFDAKPLTIGIDITEPTKNLGNFL